MVEDSSVEAAQLYAKMQFSKLVEYLPKALVERESKLVDWYSRLKGNQHTKLRLLFDFMTDLYQPIWPMTPCKKGCAACCHYPVSIFEAEINFIEREAKVKRNKVIKPSHDYHGQPCPFLHNNVCSIYLNRPFACRRHAAFTKNSYWCHPDRSNEHKFAQLRFSEVEKVYNMIVLGEDRDAAPVDIRQVFG